VPFALPHPDLVEHPVQQPQPRPVQAQAHRADDSVPPGDELRRLSARRWDSRRGRRTSHRRWGGRPPGKAPAPIAPTLHLTGTRVPTSTRNPLWHAGVNAPARPARWAPAPGLGPRPARRLRPPRVPPLGDGDGLAVGRQQPPAILPLLLEDLEPRPLPEVALVALTDERAGIALRGRQDLHVGVSPRLQGQQVDALQDLPLRRTAKRSRGPNGTVELAAFVTLGKIGSYPSSPNCQQTAFDSAIRDAAQYWSARRLLGGKGFVAEVVGRPREGLCVKTP
jgi:hypothetical protein